MDSRHDPRDGQGAPSASLAFAVGHARHLHQCALLSPSLLQNDLQLATSAACVAAGWLDAGTVGDCAGGALVHRTVGRKV